MAYGAKEFSLAVYLSGSYPATFLCMVVPGGLPRRPAKTRMIDLSVSLDAGPIGSLVGYPIPELGGGFKSNTYCLSGPVLFVFQAPACCVC